jgi:hypothetical protein
LMTFFYTYQTKLPSFLGPNFFGNTDGELVVRDAGYIG